LVSVLLQLTHRTFAWNPLQ